MTDDPVVLNLYIAAGTSSAMRISGLLRDMVDQFLGGNAEVNVFDVLTDPDAAEAADILATPTIDCLFPSPQRRAVGIPATAQALAEGLLLHHPLRKDTQ